MGEYTGKRVWIIGASSGIGAALAVAFADEGAEVILSARDRTALARLSESCRGAQVLPLDLGDRAALVSAVEVLRAAQPLDIVVCTAALYDPARVADLDADRAAQMIAVNLLGTVDVARLAPPLLRDGGQLVLFGSVAGYIGLPGGQPYSATKAAVNNLAESLRVELAPRVDVRLVCPGFVRSRLTAKNRFTMPAIIDVEEAAYHVLKGLRGRSFELHFPKRFTLGVKLLQMLPYAISLRLTARLR